MRNIPMFVTENGTASLILDQIPYRNAAYIQILDAANPEEMLQECCDFCQMAGAREVYAWGHPVVEKYPFYTAVLMFEGSRKALPETDCVAMPVLNEKLEYWRGIYNEKMEDVACSSYMTMQMAQQYLSSGKLYMVRDPWGSLCGIGTVEQDRIGAVISLQPGMGAKILCALGEHLISDRISLEVSSTNERAIRLYLRCGFKCVEEISRIHKII